MALFVNLLWRDGVRNDSKEEDEEEKGKEKRFKKRVRESGAINKADPVSTHAYRAAQGDKQP